MFEIFVNPNNKAAVKQWQQFRQAEFINFIKQLRKDRKRDGLSSLRSSKEKEQL